MRRKTDLTIGLLAIVIVLWCSGCEDPGMDGKACEDGTTGEAGEDGSNGETGNDGRNGLDGRDGEGGTAGADGEGGEVGIQGVTGPQGIPGEDGEPGATGETGTIGLQGPQGEIGSTGTAGPPGSDGEPGPGTRTVYEGTANNVGVAEVNIGMTNADDIPMLQAYTFVTFQNWWRVVPLYVKDTGIVLIDTGASSALYKLIVVE